MNKSPKFVYPIEASGSNIDAIFRPFFELRLWTIFEVLRYFTVFYEVFPFSSLLFFLDRCGCARLGKIRLRIANPCSRVVGKLIAMRSGIPSEILSNDAVSDV